MNDDKLQRLLAMAQQVDDLSVSAGEPVPDNELPVMSSFASTRHVVIRRLVLLGAGVAAAAALSLAILVPEVFTRSVSSTPQLVSGVEPGLRMVHPAPRLGTVPDALADEHCVVVAIHRDKLGGLRCVDFKPHEWDENRCLSDVSPTELRDTAMQSDPCGTPEHQMVLVALSGPRSALPTSAANAAELARCILAGRRDCDTEGRCFVGAASRCVPADVSVRIETVSAR